VSKQAASARGHQPRKRFGQHFLTDAGVIDGIVRAIAPRPGDRDRVRPRDPVARRPGLVA
jgi:hypothetical protein